MRLSRALICLLIGFFIAQIGYYYPNLPEQIASHFNASGEPDSWTSKNSFIIFEAIVLLFILSEFTLLPLLLEKSPDSLINLPNKEYWLAPQRRRETFRTMRHFLEWLAIGLLGLFIAINQTTFEANINQTNLSATTMWLIIAVFVAYALVWMIKFTGHFKIK
jgi:uncharacterized membrane protein